MKKFLFFLSKIFAIILLSAVVLDVVYTKAYLQTNKRGKIGYVYNSKPKTIDIVILGSSRAYYHLVTPMFLKEGFNTFNYGMEGSKLFESDLILKLLLAKENKIKNVILEVDLSLSSETEYSEANTLKFMPYFWDSKIIRDQFEHLPENNIEYFLPYYRFMKYETKLGFREMLSNAIEKKGSDQNDGGYLGLFYSNPELKLDLSNVEPRRNKYYEEIKSLCKKNDINLIAIMTPVCKNTKGMDYFQKINKIYPEIHNYEDVIIEDKYFSSCAHLTDEGAKIFTARILKDFFNK